MGQMSEALEHGARHGWEIKDGVGGWVSFQRGDIQECTWQGLNMKFDLLHSATPVRKATFYDENVIVLDVGDGLFAECMVILGSDPVTPE